MISHLSSGSSLADADGVPPPGVCLPGFAGVVEVLRLPFFKDMGDCCGNSSHGKHVSIFVETLVLYEEIVSAVLLGWEILLAWIPLWYSLVVSFLLLRCSCREAAGLCQTVEGVGTDSVLNPRPKCWLTKSPPAAARESRWRRQKFSLVFFRNRKKLQNNFT